MSPKNATALLVALAAAAALTGCGGGNADKTAATSSSAPMAASTVAPAAGTTSAASSAAGAPAAAGGDVTVDIVNYKFATPAVSVKVGSTVTWVNKDDFDHTATAKDKTFDTKPLKKNASGKVTFDKAGTFDYICDIHQYMTGKVVVS